ncbi:hypothetical protein RUM43_005824 [Polyplax serrata]|uniref:N-acetyltransferase ESCO2 n=1 Tax=Polyplax serrata TaxID=468196 RepID=A0AAN8S345_POLSC
MSVSGRSSSCSIIQEEGIIKRMCKTPRTPIKNCQVTPRKSDRKRSLFQSNSPTKSDDLGFMSPLSPSSSSSGQSLSSPQFSPNGQLSTPQRTPKGGTATPSPRHFTASTSKKIEVKSSLFPNLKVFTPRNKRTPRTPRTVSEKVSTPETQVANDKNLSTPKRKPRRRELFNECVVSESDSSPNTCSQDSISDNEVSDCPTILGIKPLSCENFYGPGPQRVKAQTRLFIDTLQHGTGKKLLSRSLSKESLSSNKSFVSGGSRKRTDNKHHKSRHSNPTNHVRRKSGGRTKGLQPGVWHNIKKPKQIKKLQKTEKPLISPKSRLAKMLNTSSDSQIKVKEKSLFQDNPRKRIAHSRKRLRAENDDDDMFEHHMKRRKLPSSHSIHPAVTSPELMIPDPNKKFMKYGQTRKATFTLNDSVKLNISDGVMKLQTPKKRRKLYSGKKDTLEDFYDMDEGYTAAIQSSIEGILNILEDDKVIKKSKSQVDLFNIESPTKSSKKSGRSPLKAVSNLPMMIINDFESDEEKDDSENPPIPEKRLSGVTLEKTGNMISYMTNILVNDDQDLNMSLNKENEENGPLQITNENLSPNKNKLYSLFYKQNWNKTSNTNETDNKTASAKKNIIVPDDQYLLDAGQESVGIVTCKKCGVMYQAGDFADEATHNNFHNHLSELKFTGWNNERVVGRYPDGRVIMILSSDPKIWWQKVSKIVDIVDQELGFPEASVQSLFYKTVYLYINEKSKQIAGCLIAEECKVAYKMFPPLEGVEIDSCSKDPSPCRVGISRIWTSLSHRRKGVASRMVECLQKTFFFGDIVSLDQIAFSVPSPAGKQFAQKVTGRLDFLVYGFA